MKNVLVRRVAGYDWVCNPEYYHLLVAGSKKIGVEEASIWEFLMMLA